MKTTLAIIVTLVLCAVSQTAVAQNKYIPMEKWEARAGDHIFVDTHYSVVYFIAANGNYTTLDALTGQNRVVRYQGTTYHAKTWEKAWKMTSLEKKGRSVTFGEGRFARLSLPGQIDPRFGDERTPYGFHSHLSFERMIQDKTERNEWDPEGLGYRSLGCVLISEAGMDLLANVMDANNGVVDVVTKYGLDLAAFEPREEYLVTDNSVVPSWLAWLTPNE